MAAALAGSFLILSIGILMAHGMDAFRSDWGPQLDERGPLELGHSSLKDEGDKIQHGSQNNRDTNDR